MALKRFMVMQDIHLFIKDIHKFFIKIASRTNTALLVKN